MGKRKKTIEEVKDIFEKEGYTLLDTVYINCSTLMSTICPNNHNYKIRIRDFIRGVRCSECGGLKKEDFSGN